MSRVATVAPAPFLAAREILDRQAGLKPILCRAAALQLACADTFGLLVEDRLLVVLGFWRHTTTPPYAIEMFMACEAPELVRPHVVALVAAGRLIVRRVRQDARVGRLFARVSPGEFSGRRLARAVGLGASVPIAAPGPFLEVSTGMDFSDALKHVKQGKVAWRRSWSLDRELRAVDGRLVVVFDRGGRQWLPDHDDLFADDWDSGAELRGGGR